MGAHRFQLQELYGLSTLPPPSSAQVAPGPEHERETADAEGGEDEGEELVDPHKLEAATMVVQATTNETSDGECLICLSERPTTLLLPCTHSLCRNCAIALRESTRTTRQAQASAGKQMRKRYTCPLCRRAYTALLDLSLPSK